MKIAIYYQDMLACYKFYLMIQSIENLHVLVLDLCMFLSELQNRKIYRILPKNSNHHWLK